ncbi:tetratricopeptide repeat protein [Nostoc sp. 'Lobaria pulmonaria (5183) cyanobiont']|uniref:tetratricopeptide repeat protein n=1 Tax=Nostoc sp. 'Lobaria pulmonaria (5183) cyanobiont' TaxID=1618022 RepID=UPI000CF31BA4|nr:tetratricopeptide repeat protein [Nostoc sp. 'Lobaria pulmonaria (5183) cyanobiont']AVH69485.1 TPR repeat-containing protein [Nostoc sp. 'Lobaria pulmonaria (5183) cyanobiont']
MQWVDFLTNEAATHSLSSEQTAAFVERLKNENLGKSQVKLASELNIGVGVFKKLMTKVYNKFAQSYPELATSKSRGKLEKLRACLRAKYNGSQDFGVSAQSNAAHTTIKEIHQNIPPAVPFEKFVGREAELQKLHSSLQTSRQVAIVARAGMGGVGKTQLATQYAKQHLQNYQGGVCWLSAQVIDVGIPILRFAQLKFNFIAPDEWELADRLKSCWEKWQQGEVLLVFDDVTDYETQVQPYLPPESPRFKVLLTTRQEFNKTLPQLRLDVLKPLAAMKLLKSLVDRERLKNEAWVARRICKFLGYLPLALELVGRYLDTIPDLSLEILLKRLEKKRLEHEAIAKANPLMRYEYGVAEAFALSWEQLDEKAQGLGCWLSLYALADIPLFVEAIENDNEQEFWDKAIAQLQKLHLIQWQAKGIYRLHPLIRQFFQMKLDESSEADNVKTAFVALLVEVAKQIPQQPNPEDIFNLTSAIPHIAEIATHLSQYLSNEDLICPFTGLGWFYLNQGLYQQAEPWYKVCVEVAENRLGLEHPDVATSLNNLAELYHSIGRYSEAEALYQQALSLRKRLLGDNHPDVVTSLNNLAGLYKSTRLYSKAKPLFEQALELSKRLLGDNHPLVVTSLNNLAALYHSIGRYSEAEPLYQQALSLTKRLLGDNHPDVATSLNNLAVLYESTGRYSEAQPLYQQALELRKRLLKDNHPDIATSLNNLAELYRFTERYSEAEPLYEQALELRKRLLKDNHPDVATSLNNLAELYRFTERYSEAEPLYEQALELRKRLLKDNHPDIATSLNNLGLLYGSTERYSEAEPLYLQALELRKRLLGDNHHHVANSLNNLALLYKFTGRYNEAKPVFEQALAICEQTLGVGHPNTMTIRGNYAIFLREIYR